MMNNESKDMNESLPYLYGQLLKVSDELHALYCCAVRGDDQVPTQLIGGSLYSSAAEMPYQTLVRLGQRINHYLNWAKSYQYKNENDKRKESWRAGWYLRIYEQIATKLSPELGNVKRFNDLERAQLFIGYLAEFPKKTNNKELNRDDNNEL